MDTGYSDLFGSLWEYFLRFKFFLPKNDKCAFQTRDAFLQRLETDSTFAKIFDYSKTVNPDDKYFAYCLSNEDYASDLQNHKWKYKEYLAQIAFEKLSKEELDTLQDELNQMKLNAYQEALEEEASRLNCHVSEVRPVSPVLPLKPGNDMESKFPNLPQNIFINIMKRLEIVDVFRLTLVCKKWREAVYSNPKEFNKAEYAFTTHMITFTDWMDPSINKDRNQILREYEKFGPPLINWYCELSQNLETLILNHGMPYHRLAHLLKTGVTIKHLRIEGYYGHEVELPVADVPLPNLEVFRSIPQLNASLLRLKQIILTSSNSLKAVSTRLETKEIEFIKKNPSAQNIFRNLVALETKCYTREVLELLLEAENLQLRYLGLNYYKEQYYGDMTRPFARSLIDQLLPKLSKLEVLISSCSPGITNKTIKLISKLPMNLQFAVFYEPAPFNEYEVADDEEEIHFEIKTLNDFSDALSSRCPNLDLSGIHFLMDCDEEQLRAFQEVSTCFTLATTRNNNYRKYTKFTLVCKQWKRVVYDNPTELKRAEHNLITHMISFTNWLDCPENALGFPLNPRHEEYSWCLFNWYCGVSQHLETLILGCAFSHADVVHLLHLCPRLKNLEIQRSTSFQTPKVPLSTKALHLPNLEVFCHSFSLMDPISELNRNAIVSSDCLKAFGGIFCMDDIYFIERYKPIENIYENLIALDIGFYEVEVLETLLGVDNWQLKYLKIDGQRAKYSVKSNRVRARAAIDQLLPKLKKLKIWIGSQQLGTSNRTVKLMTNLNLNLRFVVFYRTGYVLTAGDGEEPLDSQTLSTFSNRLRSRSPDMDLSESQLFMYQGDSQEEAFEDADTGFILVRRAKDDSRSYSDYPLNEQTIKQYLNLNY
eukprot:g7279.t1